LVGWLVGLWCLTPLSTIFQLYPVSQFRWLGKQININKAHILFFIEIEIEKMKTDQCWLYFLQYYKDLLCL
jgi:hypothetical protein